MHTTVEEVEELYGPFIRGALDPGTETSWRSFATCRAEIVARVSLGGDVQILVWDEPQGRVVEVVLPRPAAIPRLVKEIVRSINAARAN